MPTTADPSALTRNHYQPTGDGALVDRVTAMLDAQPGGTVTSAQLAGLDQFHVLGLAATRQLAEIADVLPGSRILDAGSGIGGPARFLAETFQADVTGVDLTPSFVAVAQLLSERVGLARLVRFEVGDLTALRFPDHSFDLVWTQHVVMNIADRDKLYAEFRRVLATGGKLAWFDVIAADDKPELLFPVPWAETAATSFLLNRSETLAALERAGFTLDLWQDVTAQALDSLSQGPPPPSSQGLSLASIMGPRLPGMVANFARNLREGRVLLAMAVLS